jgi:hypothetical protein
MTTIVGNVGVSQVAPDATSGGLPVFQCRAWVNFDGTRDSTGANSTANTARFIRASGNVSSVVRNGTGDYTVNFTTAMPDADYAWAGSTGIGNLYLNGGTNVPTTSALRVLAQSGTAAAVTDADRVSVAIFR